MNDAGRSVRSIAELVDEALDLSVDARAEWLRSLRATAPAVADEVARVFEREPELDARGFLGGEGLRTAEAEAPSLEGRRLGAYSLVRPLGRGGMGAVWLARRSDGRFDGEVAIKILNLSLLDPVGRERFRREGDTLARLAHPNIARLLDAGVTPLGQPYLVLERVDGERIDDYCDAHRLGPEARLRLFRQVLSAVAHAHAHFVVHRDLKPSNILVTADGSVMLLDFGIAKLLEPDVGAAERTELTDAAGTLLTPGYAAPEQATGAPITAATDVYALGVLAYLLLSGAHPTGTEASPAPTRLRQLLDRDPPPLASAVAPAAAELRSTSLLKLRKLFAGDLGTIVSKALEKDPVRRYPTAAALRDDLDRYLRHEPIRARPASRGYRARMFVRRNRLPVTLGAAVAATLVGATAITWNRMIEARRQRDEAHAQRDRALFEARRATAASGFMQTMLSTVGPTGRALTPTELLDEARTLLERDFAAEPAFAARMLVELSSHYAQLAQASTTRELRLRAVDLAQRSGDREALALASCALASVAGPSGVAGDPVEHLRTARAVLRGVRVDAIEPRLACLIAESRVAGWAGETDSATALARRAIALAESSGDTVSQRYIDALDALEAALTATGDVRQRLGIAGRRAAVYTRIGRGNSLGRLAALRDEADALMGLGEYRQADSAFALLAPIAAQVDSAFYENFVMIQAATLADILGRPAEALAVFDAHLQVARRLQQRDRARWLLLQRITSLIALGRVPEAEASYAAALHLTGRDGSSLARRAELDVAHGRFREGFIGYLGALELYGFPEMQTPHRSNRLITRAARAALLAGNPVAADSLAHHALELLRRLGQDERRSGEMGLAMLTRARAHLARGDSAEALHWARLAIPPLTFGFGENTTLTEEATTLTARLQRVFASSRFPPPQGGAGPARRWESE